MKKAVVIAGAVIAALGVSAFAFQGLAVRFAHWDEFKLVEHVEVGDLSQKSYDIPDDWQEYEMNGVCFKAPAGLKFDEDDGCYTDVLRTDEDFRRNARKIYIFGGELSQIDLFTEMKDISYVLNTMDVTAEDMKSFCEWSGRDYPQDGIDLYLMGADLNMEDFNIHSYRDAETFYKIGEEMANWGNLGSVRYFSKKTDDYKAFVCQTINAEPLDFEPFAAIRMLCGDGREALLNVGTGDEETDMAIISTAEMRMIQ